MTPNATTTETQNREELKSVHGHETRDIDVGGDDHDLSDMDSERQAPIEHVADNVVRRYDENRSFIREYMANAHTACIQAAKYMIRENGDEDQVQMNDVREVLAHAKDEYGYHPSVQVQYNQNDESDWTFRIEDNGIGVTRDTAPAIRDIGLSGWHDDGSTNGQFGQGTMSGFLACGPYGEFHMYTNSRNSSDNYRVAWKLTTLDQLPGERDGYGTTFEWPTFVDEATDIDVFQAVREYAEGMIVPVLYEEYDSDGDLTLEEDFIPSHIEDRYADDSPIVTFEDQFARVVWSPDSPEGWSSNIKTWCGYQPINRNDGKYSTLNKSHDMPSAFDARVKVENGCIIEVNGSTDHDLVGMVPISDQKYNNMPEKKRSGFVKRSDIPDDAEVLRAPEPTDDRDRFESKHVDAFFERYSRKLQSELKDRVSEIIEDLDGFEEIGTLDESEKSLFFTGINEYIEFYKENDADRLKDDIENVFGVVLSDDFAEKLGTINETVSWAEEGQYEPNLKSNRSGKKIWKVVEKADGDDVYMGKTVTEWKAEVAWDLKENNQVIGVDEYERWEDLFGWKKLKDLPSRRSLEDELGDQLSDNIIDKYAKKDSGVSSSSSDQDDGDTDGLSYDDKRAMKRYTTIRVGSGRDAIERHKGENIYDALDNGKNVSIRFDKFDTLVLYRQTDARNVRVGRNIASSNYGVAYAVVPNYVYDYLIEADNVMTEEEYIESKKSQIIEFDWTADQTRTQAEIRDLTESDVIVGMHEDTVEQFEEYDLISDLRTSIADALDMDSIDSITFEDVQSYPRTLARNSTIDLDEGPSKVHIDIGSSYDYDTQISVKDLFFDTAIPSIDRDAPEWEYFNPEISEAEVIEDLKTIEKSGGFASNDPTVDLPEKPEYINKYSCPDADERWLTLTLKRLDQEDQ